jgi:hypothetical protein
LFNGITASSCVAWPWQRQKVNQNLFENSVYVKVFAKKYFYILNICRAISHMMNNCWNVEWTLFMRVNSRERTINIFFSKLNLRRRDRSSFRSARDTMDIKLQIIFHIFIRNYTPRNRSHRDIIKSIIVSKYSNIFMISMYIYIKYLHRTFFIYARM